MKFRILSKADTVCVRIYDPPRVPKTVRTNGEASLADSPPQESLESLIDPRHGCEFYPRNSKIQPPPLSYTYTQREADICIIRMVTYYHPLVGRKSHNVVYQHDYE